MRTSRERLTPDTVTPAFNEFIVALDRLFLPPEFEAHLRLKVLSILGRHEIPYPPLARVGTSISGLLGETLDLMQQELKVCGADTDRKQVLIRYDRALSSLTRYIDKINLNLDWRRFSEQVRERMQRGEVVERLYFGNLHYPPRAENGIILIGGKWHLFGCDNAKRFYFGNKIDGADIVNCTKVQFVGTRLFAYLTLAERGGQQRTIPYLNDRPITEVLVDRESNLSVRSCSQDGIRIDQGRYLLDLTLENGRTYTVVVGTQRVGRDRKAVMSALKKFKISAD